MMNDKYKKLCAKWWSDRLEIKDKREEFYNALWPKIEGPRECLDVDYDPHGILLDALNEIGIKCQGSMFSGKGILPLKTLMNIWDDGIIEVREGYGSPFEVIGNWHD